MISFLIDGSLKSKLYCTTNITPKLLTFETWILGLRIFWDNSRIQIILYITWKILHVTGNG